MTRRTGRKFAALVVVVALSVACSTEAPKLSPRREDGPVEALQAEQLQRVLTSVRESTKASNDAKSIEPSLQRVGGPELESRTSIYKLRQLGSQIPLPPSDDTELEVDLFPTGQKWPREGLVITRASAPDSPLVYSLLHQESPRTQYVVIASATSIPGTGFAQLGGQDPVQLQIQDRGDLIASPSDTVGAYGDVLARGRSSQWVGNFDDNQFFQTLIDEQTKELSSVSCPNCYTYSATHTLRPGVVWAVRADDGSALVMGVLDGVRTFSVAAPGASLPLTGDLQLLSGRPDANTNVVIKQVETVVMRVPKADSGQKVTLVAAARTIQSVTL